MGVLSAGMRVAGIAAVGLGNSLKAAFLSNPIGIALVAATTALTFFMSATGDAAAATSDFTGAVDENTGALTDNAAQVVARTVAESGAAQMYKDAGGNVADYTAALTGNADKQALVIKTLTDAAKAAAANAEATNAASGAATSYSGGLGSQEGAFRNATGALQTFRDDLAKVNEAQDKGKLTAEGAAGATDAVGGAAAKAASPMDQLKTATEGLNTAASLADAAVQFLTADLDAAAGGAISAEQATRLNEAAFRGIADAARGYQAAQDGVTEAGLKVKEAQDKLNKAQTDGKSSAEEISQAQLDLAAANRDNEAATGKVAAATDTQFNANIQARDSALKLASSAYATAAANGNLQGAVDSANAVIEDQRTKFINAQVAAGMEAGAATDLATKLFGIPGKVGTDISEKGGDAVILQAQNVTRYLQGVPNSKVISIDAAGNAQAVINGISVSLANMQSYKQVVVETIQRSGSNAAVANGGAFDVMADGGMVHAAAGLITGRGQSQVRMGAGGGVTWAEGITGKEYYLSMKPGMQDRNRGLASQAVSDLGGQAVWGGDVRTGAGTMSSAGGGQPINLTLTLLGDGPITEAALGAAQVTVDSAMRNVALLVKRSAGESR
jgi:hypothetical protein